jgi:tRNA (guanine6-N2)-methyltransferase
MKKTVKNTYLCEVTEGLEFVTAGELQRIGAQVIAQKPGEIDFSYSGDPANLLRLKTVQSVSLVQLFDVPRPRALLSNEFLPRIMQQIETVRRLSARDAYKTFLVAAAGSETAVMQRIKEAITAQTGLKLADDKGDLWVRIRPGRAGGWETIIRIAPRPLVTRPWRVCNLEGALNAATAHALILLTQPQPRDVFVNLGCGSGTLLIERLAYGSCRLALGIDRNAEHLHCARANVEASGYADKISLQRADMIRLPLLAASVDVLCADLPFGQLSGTHRENEWLYPVMLGEAARVARPGARFVLITHEVKLMENTLRQNAGWSLEQTIRVNLRGLHPRVYVLQRATNHMN